MEFHAEIEKTEKKEGWGGAREGAGRKRKGVHYYGFRATQEVHDILKDVEGSKADFINQCILIASGKADGQKWPLKTIPGAHASGVKNETISVWYLFPLNDR